MICQMACNLNLNQQLKIEPLLKEAADMSVSRFEDLIGWQKSRILFNKAHEITSKPPLSKNYPLRDQMRRSSLSVMSNIAEGFDRGGDKEFVQYLFISKGSCSELRSQLYAAKDVGYLDPEEFKTAFELAEETSKILQGLIKAIKKRDETGHKFK